MTTKRNDLEASARGALLRNVTPDAPASSAADPTPDAAPVKGRKGRQTGPKRSGQRISVYLTPAELAECEAAAEREAMAASAWARSILLREARRP